MNNEYRGMEILCCASCINIYVYIWICELDGDLRAGVREFWEFDTFRRIPIAPRDRRYVTRVRLIM